MASLRLVLPQVCDESVQVLFANLFSQRGNEHKGLARLGHLQSRAHATFVKKKKKQVAADCAGEGEPECSE